MNVNEQYQELLDAAFAAMQHAYAPYSAIMWELV